MRIKSAFYLCASLTCASAFISAAFSVAALVTPGAAVTALYAAARSLPLAAVASWLVYRHSRVGMVVLASLMAQIQACDAVIGIIQRDPAKTIGPAVLAIATTVSAVMLSRRLRDTVEVAG